MGRSLGGLGVDRRSFSRWVASVDVPGLLAGGTNDESPTLPLQIRRSVPIIKKVLRRRLAVKTATGDRVQHLVQSAPAEMIVDRDVDCRGCSVRRTQKVCAVIAPF